MSIVLFNLVLQKVGSQTAADCRAVQQALDEVELERCIKACAWVGLAVLQQSKPVALLALPLLACL